MTAAVHIVGAGLSGLSTAVQLTKAGKHVFVYEAANHAGGRCRSYFDQTLNRRIDNGNHLVLSGNQAVAKYLGAVGAADSLWETERAEFPFVDLRSGERWVVRPDQGIVPWSLISPSKRVPGSSIGEYLRGLRLAFAGPDKTVGACLDQNGPLYHRFWEPLAVSVLNTDPSEASARLLWPVLRETFGRGERACRALIAKEGLSESFIDPACRFLEREGGVVALGTRIKSLGSKGAQVSSLRCAERLVDLDAGDRVVLAVPPSIAQGLVPNLTVPNEFRAIVNAHFKLPGPPSPEVSFVGLVGGIGHWLFVRDGIASVTVSAAEHIIDQSAEELAHNLWPEIITALELGAEALGSFRIVKEKRATFAQTPEQVRKRPEPKTSLTNLFVAGDWTATGLPATIEGSLLSGELAAEAVLKSL